MRFVPVILHNQQMRFLSNTASPWVPHLSLNFKNRGNFGLLARGFMPIFWRKIKIKAKITVIISVRQHPNTLGQQKYRA